MIADPIEFELFKNSILSIADEMALTIFRTTYSGVLKDNMDYSTAMFDGVGNLVAQGLTLPGHLGSMPTAMQAMLDAFERRHQSRRHLCAERPVPRRHAPAGHLRLQTSVLSAANSWPMPPRSATTPMSAAGSRFERIGFHRDLPGRSAHPAAQDVRPRQAQRDPVRADRDERADAGPGVRRPARPARGLPHLRAIGHRTGEPSTACRR